MNDFLGDTGIGDAIEQGKQKDQEREKPKSKRPEIEEPKYIPMQTEGFTDLYDDDENGNPKLILTAKQRKKASEEVALQIIDVNLFLLNDKAGNPNRISIDKFTEYLLVNFDFKTLFGMNKEIIYFLEDGIWKPTGRKIIKTEAERILGEWCKNNLVLEVVEKIKRQTAISPEEFNIIPEGLICLENCVLDLNTNKTMKHSPEYYFKTKIPITHNPKSKCPAIETFFSQVLYPEDIPLIQEWFGYNLYNSYFEKKAVILFGDTDTGKTITINLLTALIGEKNKVGLGLQQITQGKGFDLFHLKDKYANIYDDLSAKDLTDNGGFKIATGGGYITGEQKFGDLIDFKTFAKLTFATNKIPPVKQVDDNAYYKRWLPIPFDNQFKEEDQNKHILKELTTQEELSGLLNWAIKGLQRLIKNNGFSFNKSIEEVKAIMQRSSHPLAHFSQDCLELEQGHKITKEEMFEIYTTWCLSTHNSPMSKTQLGRQLTRFMPGILPAKSGGERYWLNAKRK